MVTISHTLLFILTDVAVRFDDDDAFTNGWAESSKWIENYHLDPDNSWDNVYVVPTIVPSVYDDGEIVDKLMISITVPDIADVMDNQYKARLERSGKGIFIFMPRAPKYRHDNVEALIPGGRGVDNSQDHQALSIQALTIQENEQKRIRLIYYKFPEDIMCDMSHFNDDRRSSNLQTKMAPYVLREIPGTLSRGADLYGTPFPKTQFIISLYWECVVSSSVQKVKKKVEDDVFNLLFSGMETSKQHPPSTPPGSAGKKRKTDDVEVDPPTPIDTQSIMS